jgi:hypothetical protein
VKQSNEFFQQILASNGVNYTGLFPIDIEFKALGLLGYEGTIIDRRRAFYESRTGSAFLSDAIYLNNPNE